jgi:hypothetical protein
MAELAATVLWEIGGAAVTDAAIFIAANATAINTVALVAAGQVQANHQRRKAIAQYNANLEDRLVMTPTTSGPRSRCYGRVRNVDGVLFKATRGATSEFYTLFIAVAGHEIDGFETVYFGDVPVTLDGSGYVQEEPWRRVDKKTRTTTITLDGAGNGSHTAAAVVVAGSASGVVTSAGDDILVTVTSSGATINAVGPAGAVVSLHWQETTGASKARVRFYTGAPGQDVSTVLAPLFPSLITAGVHRFAGIAGLLVDLEFDPDAFPTGVPQISAVFRGAKVLDPRTGTTAWTENPGLIARDWALYPNGGACAVDDLVESTFTAAANDCDPVQAFPVTTGTVSLPLYTCGTVCSTEADPWLSFQEIVESMAGKAGWAGGALRVVAGVYRAPVATITDDWIGDQADVQIVPEPPADEAVNVYRPTIADKAQDYVAVPSPEVRAATYITADGRELPREVTLGAVTDTTHAQHVCGVLMRDARNGLTVTLPCNLRAYQLELFDVVAVTLARFGWSAKIFEVVDWQFSLAGGVLLTLKETAAAIFQPDASFAVLDLTPNTLLPDPSVVPQVGTLTVTSGTAALNDGTMVARVVVAWPAVADEGVRSTGRIEVQYALAADTLPAGDWPSVSEAGNATSTTLAGLKMGTAYVLRARAINALGVHGAWSVQYTHLVASVSPGTTTDLASETWTIVGPVPIHPIMATTYVNTSTAVLTVAATAFASRKLTADVGSTTLGAASYMTYSINGGATTGSVGFKTIDGAVPGTPREWSDSIAASYQLNPGDSITVRLVTAIVGAFAGTSTLETVNGHLRLAVSRAA